MSLCSGQPNIVGLKASTSWLPNNLSCVTHLNHICLLYTHGSGAHVTRISSFEDKAPEHEQVAQVMSAAGVEALGQVMQAKWCVTKLGNPLAVVASLGSIQILSHDGVLLCEHREESAIDKPQETAFFRGICMVGTRICVGHSSGKIFVFSVGDSEAVRYQRTLAGHGQAITELAASSGPDPVMVSADENGSICVYGGDDLPILKHISGVQQACYSVAVTASYIVTGFANGTIVLLDRTNYLPAAEINAHARQINGLAVDLHSDLVDPLASVGDDCKLLVWALPPPGSDADICLKFSATITDRKLTGVAYHAESSSFNLTCYDSTRLLSFPKKKH